MGVLKFDNVDDRLRWTTLASALANTSDGAWTMVAVVKRNAVSDFGAISYLLSGAGAGVTEAGMSFNGSSQGICDFGGGVQFSSTLTSTANPYMIAVSKGAGSATPRLGWKLGSGGAWTHENAGAAQTDRSAATMLDIGVWEATGDPLDAWVGVVAFYEGAMSDVNKQALDDNWRTSDLWNNPHGHPTFLVELNVVAASVVDLAGNASVTSHVGTTLDAGETLNSWTFDGTGAATATTSVLPVRIPNAYVGPMALRRLFRRVPWPQTGATSVTYTDSGSGTITLSGSGSESQTHTASGSGTVTLSGARAETQTHTGSGTGTITLSGTGTQSASHTATGAGTVTLAGAFSQAQTHSASGTGTVTLSGSGFDEFIPPGTPAVNTGYDQVPVFIVTH